MILQIGDKEIFITYDGERLEFDEEEYYQEVYGISSVGIDAYEARLFISSQGDTIRYRLYIPNDYNEDGQYPLVLFHHGAGGIVRQYSEFRRPSANGLVRRGRLTTHALLLYRKSTQ